MVAKEHGMPAIPEKQSELYPHTPYFGLLLTLAVSVATHPGFQRTPGHVGCGDRRALKACASVAIRLGTSNFKARLSQCGL
jgi:hypothetical protein